jgi:hypothetical protein
MLAASAESQALDTVLATRCIARNPERVVRDSLYHAATFGRGVLFIDCESFEAPAGRVAHLAVDEAAIVASVEWSEHARKHFMACEFRYIGVVFNHDGRGTIVRILNVSLQPIGPPPARVLKPLPA